MDKYALYDKNTGRLVGLKSGLEIAATEGFMPQDSNTNVRPVSNEEYARLRAEQTKRLIGNFPSYM